MIFLIITQIRSFIRSRSFISIVNFECYAVELSRVDEKKKFLVSIRFSGVRSRFLQKIIIIIRSGLRGSHVNVISQQFHLFTL